MTRLGAIDFDHRILDALRNDRLVVFAGAGVSMGAPSNLPDFEKLARDIAAGSGYEPDKPFDRFLGHLQHRGVSVHERAAQILSREDSNPNALHCNLLRLFNSAGRSRIITTNFDLHFESASRDVFGEVPEVFRAPALPLGYDFTGIVHIHGALPRPKSLVLTDADFGRAYLTEGWARRFLVDVFRSYTVLFVGYSHDDVVMNYLARALPADGIAGRFALTDEEESWNLLGIAPILFSKTPAPDEYRELYEGVRCLAERTRRGALDWQSRILELGSRPPPADEESIGEIEQALREPNTTKFLTDVARDPEWIRWLHARKHLDPLFRSDALGELDGLLALWLANYFAIEHADAVIELLAAYDLRMNPKLWGLIGREIGLTKEKLLEDVALKRWVAILLASAPDSPDDHVLTWLADRCATQNLVKDALSIFLFMGRHRLKVKRGIFWPGEETNASTRRLTVECIFHADHWTLNEVWSKQIKPSMTAVVQPLLSGLTQQLESIHRDLVAWNKADSDWDPVCYGRSAIEPNEQDQYPEAVDVLIDALRDLLEFIAINLPARIESLAENLLTSNVPLLRRLAIHVIGMIPSWSPDKRLDWLLDKNCLHRVAEHHEVYRAVAVSYGEASDAVRSTVIAAVQAYTLPEFEDRTAEMRTARSHFDWLTWLLLAKPDCELINAALAPIRAQYLGWLPRDYPDFTHWSGPVTSRQTKSPWTVEQLLAKAPCEQIEDLLGFRGDQFDGPDRTGLVANTRGACKQNSGWAFALASILAEQSLWASDLWPAVISGLQESELTVDGWHQLLAVLSNPGLFVEQTSEIADLLYFLVKDGGRPFVLEVLDQANAIALPLWQAAPSSNEDEGIDDWLSRAINRPAGIIVEFWINGLSLLLRSREGRERVLPDEYRYWFTLAIQDPTTKGGLARSVIASQTAFLFGLDKAWAQEHVIPLFSDPDDQRFAQAWDGFLVWGRLYPDLADALMPAFLSAIVRMNDGLVNRKSRFIQFFTALCVFHVDDPTLELLPEFFRNSSQNSRVGFSSRLGYFLRNMKDDKRRQLWDRWLRRYWSDRIQGMPAPLCENEIKIMLDWLAKLGDIFPEAIDLVERQPRCSVAPGLLLHDLSHSDLVDQYQNETARLLIYLCKCDFGYHPIDINSVASRLINISTILRHQLNEAMAGAGIIVN